MNLRSHSGLARVACLLVFASVTAFGLVGCADNYATAPVYRGAYYAYDAYPYGYHGYPGYPYYGAPFGNSASMVRAERSAYAERSGKGSARRSYLSLRASRAHEQTSRNQQQ